MTPCRTNYRLSEYLNNYNPRIVSPPPSNVYVVIVKERQLVLYASVYEHMKRPIRIQFSPPTDATYSLKPLTYRLITLLTLYTERATDLLTVIS